jgi:hypothetical protein
MECRIIQESYLIIEDLKRHSTKEALKWYNANRSKLLKVLILWNERLHCMVLDQEYI